MIRNSIFCVVALLAIGLSIFHLERARSGLDISTLVIEDTPATRYRFDDTDGPLVVVAHGFAGSQQLMQAYSLTLARAGYDVIAFDFEGHGRNSVPMSGDVTAIDGTTRLLVEQTQRVMDAASALNASSQGIALLGHSMATDVILRAALAELDSDVDVATIVGISMYSEAITKTAPSSLLIINGQWEGRLREPALKQLQLIDPQAVEGDTAELGDVIRRVVVAPHVEHVSVLYSTSALNETLAWLNMTYGRSGGAKAVSIGGWILLLLAGIVLLFKPLVLLLPKVRPRQREIPVRTFWKAVLLPTFIAPMIAFLPAVEFLPVLVADYLMMHLALFGLVQLSIVRLWLPRINWQVIASPLLLALWGILVFGFALDRYAASFLPTAGRLAIVLVLCAGTVLFMVGDSLVSGVGHGRLWRRIVARFALIVSLVVAAAIDPDRLIFLLLILPVLILFYLVHGLMGRWIAQRSGALAAGLGLGLCLAWALGVSFPLFDAP